MLVLLYLENKKVEHYGRMVEDMKYTLTNKKEYDIDALPRSVFEELENEFPCRESPSLYGRTYKIDDTYKFRPYRVDVIGTKRILSTDSKEVQNFIESL